MRGTIRRWNRAGHRYLDSTNANLTHDLATHQAQLYMFKYRPTFPRDLYLPPSAIYTPIGRTILQELTQDRLFHFCRSFTFHNSINITSNNSFVISNTLPVVFYPYSVTRAES